MYSKYILLLSIMSIVIASVANAGCREGYLDAQFEPVAFPGDADYRPESYARELYRRFGENFEAPNQQVVIATLTPMWDRDQPLPHEKHSGGEFAYLSTGQLSHDLIYEYPHAYEIAGQQISAAGVLPLSKNTAGLRVRLGEGYTPRPIWTEEPRLFAVEDDVRFIVDAVVCYETTWPAPTSAALDHLVACVANAGCEDQG